MSTDILLVEKADRVAVLRMNRPGVLNALDPALLAALIDAVEACRTDASIGAVVLTGAGRAFSAGGDLKAQLAMDKAQFREYILQLQRLSADVRALPKPVVGALHGYVLAGGFELAAICDLRIAADDTIFGLPDTPIGLSPTSALTYLLPRIVGLGWAKHLTLTGEWIDARKAESIGLVTRVVPRADVEREAVAFATKMAGYPPLGIRYVKQGFAVAADVDFHAALTQETDAEVACFDTDEVRANLLAFSNRKKAKPSGG